MRSRAASGGYLAYDSDTSEVFVDSSSRRYKTDIEDVDAAESAGIWALRPVSYRGLGAEADAANKMYGFIAEEVAEVDPRLCFWSTDAEGRPQVEGVKYDRVVPLLLHQAKALKATVDAMQTANDELKAELKAANDALQAAHRDLRAAREADRVRLLALEEKLAALLR